MLQWHVKIQMAFKFLTWKMSWSGITCHRVDTSVTYEFLICEGVQSKWNDYVTLHPPCAWQHLVQLLCITWCWVRIWPVPLCALIFGLLWTIISQRSVTFGSEAIPCQCMALLLSVYWQLFGYSGNSLTQSSWGFRFYFMVTELFVIRIKYNVKYVCWI